MTYEQVEAELRPLRVGQFAEIETARRESYMNLARIVAAKHGREFASRTCKDDGAKCRIWRVA